MKWKEIPGTEGKYLISDTGKVFSVIKNKMIAQGISNQGYARVEIKKDGIRKKYGVHRLVAETFIPNPNEYPVVNHKDENPLNNNANNLEWCTYKYNSNYGHCIEKRQEQRMRNGGYHSGASNPRSIPAYCFDKDGTLVGSYESARQAAIEMNLDRKSVSKAVKGWLKTTGGYVWNTEPIFPSWGVKERNFYGGKYFRAGAVLRFDASGKFIKRYETPNDAKADGFDPNGVRDTCRGKRKMHKGSIFKYE